MRLFCAIILSSSLALLSGCSGTPVSNTVETNSLRGTALQGKVHGGQQPIAGASVYLYAANATGYGNASVSLLTGGNGTSKDSNGNYYVTTDSNGSFTISNDYNCPSSSSQVYIYSAGGSASAGANPSAGLLAGLGSCGNLTSSTYVVVNEVSTIATAYSVAAFATDALHVSSSGSGLATTGIANAFATVTNLETLNTGVAMTTAPAGNGAVPQSEINTLSNILAACINSNGAVTGPANPTPCYTLFTNALSGGTSGTQPTDTAMAAMNIAHNPGAKIANLYALSTPTAPFQPTLPTAPSDFTISLSFTGGGMATPGQPAIDASGNIWVGNVTSISKFSPTGSPLSGGSGFTGGVSAPSGLAIDNSGNVWVANFGSNSISEFNSNGAAVSGSPFSGGGLNQPYGIAIDKSGNVWVGNYGSSSVSEFTSGGSPITGSAGYTFTGLAQSDSIAVDTSNNIWVNGYGGGVLAEFNSGGMPLAGSTAYSGSFAGLLDGYNVAIDASGKLWVPNYSYGTLIEFEPGTGYLSPSGGYFGGGLYDPVELAIDGSNNIWVANYKTVGLNTTSPGNISEFNSSGVAITGNSGYLSSWTNQANGIAVDLSGNIWVPSSGNNSLTEYVGLASPVVAPIIAYVIASSSGGSVPSITSILPNPATVGTSVTITGTNFGATQGGSTLTFNGTTASPATWSATSITVPVPVLATTGNVVVTVGGQASNGYSFTVSPPAPSIANIEPNPAAVGTSVTITGTNFGATQSGSTVTFNGTTASPTSWDTTSITTPVPVGATTGNVIVTVGGQASNGFAFEVSGGTMPGDVITWRYNNSRDGVNPNETTLTTANVNSTTFGKVGEFTVNGRIDGEVLYLGQISISGQMKNVVYFATENDVVYAVDADSISGSTATILWSASLVPGGEAPAVPNETGATCGNVVPTGIEGTPVIDRSRNAIYVVTKTMSSTTNTTQFFRLHALNLTNGAELFGGPATVSATYPGTAGNVSGGVVTFSPRDQSNRPGLLETGSNLYLAFGGQYGDCGEYSGFLMSYNADTLAQSGAIDLNPNSIQGGMWNSGAGPSADVSGSVYVSIANAGDDNSIGPNDYPNSVVRLTNFGELAVADYFTPDNTETLDKEDLDLGSSGVLIMPDLVDSQSMVHQYAIAAGKDGNMYVVDRDNLGQFSTSTNKTIQTIVINGSGAASFNYSTPTYFNNNVYVCPSGQTLKAFAVSNALLATSATMSTTPAIGTSGFIISANGTSNGIVWAIQPTNGNGVLYAFNASSLSTMLYASNQAAANRDQTAQILGNFHTPTVANGKVYFGTGSTVAVFGLLP